MPKKAKPVGLKYISNIFRISEYESCLQKHKRETLKKLQRFRKLRLLFSVGQTFKNTLKHFFMSKFESEIVTGVCTWKQTHTD